jgi:hypothetical protein
MFFNSSNSNVQWNERRNTDKVTVLMHDKRIDYYRSNKSSHYGNNQMVKFAFWNMLSLSAIELRINELYNC